MQGINIESWLLVGMSLTNGSDDRFDAAGRTDCLQPPFVDLLTPTLLPNRWMGCLGAEKRADAGEAKTAFAILADLARSGGKQGVGHAVEVLFRHEHHYLHLTAFRSTAQRPDLGEGEAVRQQLVDAAACIIKSCVRTVDGDAGAD